MSQSPNGPARVAKDARAKRPLAAPTASVTPGISTQHTNTTTAIITMVLLPGGGGDLTVTGKYGPSTRVEVDGRVCSGPCGQFKLWSEFHKCGGASLTGHMSACKECRKLLYPDVRTSEQRRIYHLAKKYGISVWMYKWLLGQRDGLCWLCGEAETWINPQSQQVAPLAVDHDHGCSLHEVKRACYRCIRGLLCNRCNRLLGFAESSPVLAARFADYLSLRPLIRAWPLISASVVSRAPAPSMRRGGGA